MARVVLNRVLRNGTTYAWIAVMAVAVAAAAAFQPQSAFNLLVRNDNAAAARIFVGDGANWKYIGPVRSRSIERFDVSVLDQSGSPLRLLATVGGGRDTVRVGPLTVLTGQSVELTLGEDLSRSGAVVR